MDDTKKSNAGENSKKVENLDSPQFQEMVRGFMVEKELLEKRHQEEIEKLKENFSKKESVLSESHGGGQVNSETSHFDHSSSTMTGHSVQKQMIMNGARYGRNNFQYITNPCRKLVMISTNTKGLDAQLIHL
jgi:hypothetical protein